MINQNIEFKEAMLENDFDMAMNIYKLNREKYDAEILAIEAYVEADRELEIYTESFSDITKGFIDKSKRIIQAIIDNIIKAFNFIWKFFSDFIKTFFNINFKDKLVKQAYEISLCNLDSLRERVDISCSWCKNYTSKAYEFFDSIKSDEHEKTRLITGTYPNFRGRHVNPRPRVEMVSAVVPLFPTDVIRPGHPRQGHG